MISSKIQDAINEQINYEFWSAYFYLSMSLQFEAEGRTGIANWYQVQFKEELAHAQIFMDYVIARGGRVTLEPVAAVPTHWENVLTAFEDTLHHEEEVTRRINALYALAEEERDYATRGKLDWFVKEQVEEEETVKLIIERLRLVGADGLALFMLDNELGGRAYTDPLAQV